MWKSIVSLAASAALTFPATLGAQTGSGAPPPFDKLVHHVGTDKGCQVNWYIAVFHTGELAYAKISPFDSFPDQVRQIMKLQAPQLSPSDIERLLPEVSTAICDMAGTGINLQCTDGGWNSKCQLRQEVRIWDVLDREICTARWAPISVNPPLDGQRSKAELQIFDAWSGDPADKDNSNFVIATTDVRQKAMTNARSWIHTSITFTAIPPISDEARSVLGCVRRYPVGSKRWLSLYPDGVTKEH